MTFDLNKLTANPDLSFKPEGSASEVASNVSSATPSAFDTLIKSYNASATPAPPVVQPRQPDPVQATRTIQSGDSNPDDDADNDADNFPEHTADTAQHLAQVSPPKANSVKDNKAPVTAKTAEAKPAATTAAASAATATATPATISDAKAATATQNAATLLAGLIGVQQTAQPAAQMPATSPASQLSVDANGKAVKPDAKAANGKAANGKTPVTGDDGQDNGPATPATTADAKSAFDAALAKVKADLSGGQDRNSSSQDQSAAASATLVTPASTSVTAPAFSFVSDTVVPPTYAQTGATDASGTATGMSQVAVDTMSNLSLQISKRLTDGNTKFNLELHPADLGRVDVALTIGGDGKTSAHLSFDSPVTAARFSANESELRNQLSQAGLNVSSDGLSFTSRNEGNATSDNAMQQGFQQNAQNQGHAYRDDARQQTPASSGADSVPAIASADTDIDTYLAGLTGAATTTGRLALNLIV